MSKIVIYSTASMTNQQPYGKCNKRLTININDVVLPVVHLYLGAVALARRAEVQLGLPEEGAWRLNYCAL
jgi:hypothetical protein